MSLLCPFKQADFFLRFLAQGSSLPGMGGVEVAAFPGIIP
jgi:hypothetical protein